MLKSSRRDLILIASCLYFSSAPVVVRCATDPNVATIGASSSKVWRTENCCGLNSLYFVLRLFEIDVTYEDVERQLHIGEQGSSIVELRDTAAHFGLPLRAVKGRPEQLLTCPLPAIAHFEEESKTTGHYVVITECSARGIRLVDGTTVMQQEMSLADFQRKWTGYLLVQDRPKSYYVQAITLIILSSLAAGLMIWNWQRRPVVKSL